MAFEQRSLDDYIDVAQRIADFRKAYPDGYIQPLDPKKPYEVVQAQGFEKNGDVITQTFIVVVAAAYRDMNSEPGVGMAWEIFPGRTPYTRGSELQNAETSAWGRAIIAVGASDSKRGIASREEVRNRQAERGDIQCPFCKDTYTDMDAHMIADLKGCGTKYRVLPLSDRELLFLPRNQDGSLSRSRTSDAEKAAAGVMTDAEQRAHNALAKPPPNTAKVIARGESKLAGGRVVIIEPAVTLHTPIGLSGGRGVAGPLAVAEQSPGRFTVVSHRAEDAGIVAWEVFAARAVDRSVDAAVDDRWTTDAPSWLVGVDPPEDQPGSILPAQRSQIMAVYTALGIKDRDKRLADVSAVLGTEGWPETVNDLSHQQAARLLENLHERHTGKMTRR